MLTDGKCTCGGYFEVKRIDGDTTYYCPRCYTHIRPWEGFADPDQDPMGNEQ